MASRDAQIRIHYVLGDKSGIDDLRETVKLLSEAERAQARLNQRVAEYNRQSGGGGGGGTGGGGGSGGGGRGPVSRGRPMMDDAVRDFRERVRGEEDLARQASRMRRRFVEEEYREKTRHEEDLARRRKKFLADVGGGDPMMTGGIGDPMSRGEAAYRARLEREQRRIREKNIPTIQMEHRPSFWQRPFAGFQDAMGSAGISSGGLMYGSVGAVAAGATLLGGTRRITNFANLGQNEDLSQSQRTMGMADTLSFGITRVIRDFGDALSGLTERLRVQSLRFERDTAMGAVRHEAGMQSDAARRQLGAALALTGGGGGLQAYAPFAPGNINRMTAEGEVRFREYSALHAAGMGVTGAQRDLQVARAAERAQEERVRQSTIAAEVAAKKLNDARSRVARAMGEGGGGANQGSLISGAGVDIFGMLAPSARRGIGAARQAQSGQSGSGTSIIGGVINPPGRNDEERRNALQQQTRAAEEAARAEERRQRDILELQQRRAASVQSETQLRRAQIQVMQTQLQLEQQRTQRMVNYAGNLGRMNIGQRLAAESARETFRMLGPEMVGDETRELARLVDPALVEEEERRVGERIARDYQARGYRSAFDFADGRTIQGQMAREVNLQGNITQQINLNEDKLAKLMVEALSGPLQQYIQSIQTRMEKLFELIRSGQQQQQAGNAAPV